MLVVHAVGKKPATQIQAGIRPMDNVAGVELGKSMARVFISWAQNDGSQ
jgi:hypothetical protein